MSINLPMEPIAIRLATEDDRDQLRRLAQLDSASVPAGRLIVGESAGSIRAAVAIDGGAAIADPFHPTAELVALLRARAEQAPGQAAGRPRIVARSHPREPRVRRGRLAA